MMLREKLLYHHAHPAKLAVDVVSAVVATQLFWGQHPLRGGLIGLVPPAIASLAVMLAGDLERMKRSRVGQYVGTHMSLTLHTAAVAGVLVLWTAAWYRSLFYCSVGLLITAFAWARGPLHAWGQPVTADVIRTRSRR